MWRRFCGALLAVMAAWFLASCNTTRKAAAPAPESEQAISEALKGLYMAASAAAPQSPEQQKVILRMAEKASNGKELLLVMRAADGVFPSDAGSQAEHLERQVRSLVTAKMMQVATLEQMVEYATGHAVDPENARALVQRMFELGNENSDPRAWYRIRGAAFHLKVSDLERQAQARAEKLAGR
jgi:hypothetical protein